MTKISRLGRLAGACGLLGIVVAGSAMAQADLPVVNAQPTDIGSCRAPTSHAGTSNVLTCRCPAAASDPNSSSSVWGTDIYTADSYICATARHAGVIDASGGQVTLQMLPGQSRYEGTLRNGVQTRSYGRYGASYRYVTTASAQGGPASATLAGGATGGGFDAVVDLPGFDMTMIRSESRGGGLGGLIGAAGRATGNRAVAEVATAGGELVDNLPDHSSGALDIGECRSIPPRYRGEPNLLLSCTCPNRPSERSPIWGTGIYSGDSAICKAAIQAGAIDRTGGRVAIQTLPDQPSYEGNTYNGVTSLAYGPTNGLGAYRFVR